jgi:hypothetical protein
MPERDVQIGKTISCRLLLGGLVTNTGRNRSVTISLLSFQNKKTVWSFSSSVIRRHTHALDKYDYGTRFDTTLMHVKVTIEDFYRCHMPISP